MFQVALFNIWPIIKSHFKTLHNKKDNKPAYAHISIFYILPIILFTFIFYFYRTTIDSDLVNIMVQAFSILVGFLFNALIMLIPKRKEFDDSEKYSKRITLINETFANTAFGILLSLLIIILSIFLIFISSKNIASVFNILSSLGFIVSGLLVSLVFIFICTLIMVLKRINKIFNVN